MRVADKTVAFVKEWVNGQFTRRQYQNYYVVKTEHAEFLLKLTEKRELLATKDKTNHVYIWDCNGAEDEAFSGLVYDSEFVFPNSFTNLQSYKLSGDVDQISKFRVCNRVKIENTRSANINITLFALGNKRFYTQPDRELMPKAMPLSKWATFAHEGEFGYCYHTPLQKPIETIPNIETVADIRGHYMELAGEKLDSSTVIENDWITIPTDYKTTEEIANMPLLKLRQTRPDPFAYGLNAQHFDMDKLVHRFETTEENIDLLTRCFQDTKRVLPERTKWREYLCARFPSDLALRYITFIEADDKWLTDNWAAAKVFALERKIRKAIGTVDGWLYAEPSEDTKKFGPWTIYTKTDSGNFVRIVPTPLRSRVTFGPEDEI